MKILIFRGKLGTENASKQRVVADYIAGMTDGMQSKNISKYSFHCPGIVVQLTIFN